MLDLESPVELSEALGARVRALRLQRNLTQQRLSQNAGISRPTLGALERGRGTLETLARVLYALGREEELKALAEPDPPMTLDAAISPTPRQRARG